jgi:hypothetical protein
VTPNVDLVLLTRDDAPIHPDVKRGINRQVGVHITVHRVIGEARRNDACRWDTIARARNKGRSLGSSPWVMFLDDDVVLEPTCVSQLVAGLKKRPVYGALAADYLDQSRRGQIAPHVAMGATLFRREALEKIRFTWRGDRCECQCCCDLLRRLLWGIDYYPSAKARHLSKARVDRTRSKLSAVSGNVPVRGRILTAFNRRHIKPFVEQFLRTLRRSGNKEWVAPLALGLYPSERARLAHIPKMKPAFRADDGRKVARQRLHGFQQILKSMSPSAPVAYWDAGDIVFQERLQPLWELVQQYPNKLLVVREPVAHPETPTVVNWTRGIVDQKMRRKARQLLYPNPWLNGGFVAGCAAALLRYFRTVENWYDSPRLAGSSNRGDQLALNVYCHSNPDVWHEAPEGWNYCLCRRDPKSVYRREDGRYVDVRGVPIYVVHGNGGNLHRVSNRRRKISFSLIE